MTAGPPPGALAWLSTEQRAAVLAPAGPLLIVAGPGTGKTATLAERIVQLLRSGQASLTEILALTFSRTAARALAARLALRLGPAGAAVQATTFHAFGLDLAQRWGQYLGLDPACLTVYAGSEARALLVEVLGDAREPPPGERLPALAAAVEAARLALAAGEAPPPGIAALAEAYERRLRERAAIDFPGMLAAPLRLFREQPAILARYQATYRWVFADEFQDVAPPQYALLRLLAAGHGNLTVVGDACQTLYDWRGADATFLLDFVRSYPGARVVRLTQNFRSTGHILAVANALGAHLPYGQPLWTANPPGPSPVLHAARDPSHEAAFIAGEITRLLTGGTLAYPSEVAILARTNQQLAPLRTALQTAGIPCGTAPGRDAGAWVGTIHRAKGSEWRAVFVVGLEDDLLPHRRALTIDSEGPADANALAGELHAAYVAITRPRERLYLTHCRRRDVVTPDGATSWRRCQPSRFLRLLPAAALARAA
jgi:DNA helicase II / ATP-dependent DNA helicase PcrA